ncbi:MAG: relaxase domain-containing protein [Flavipsychrobacter sp.]|nr:relaxase domain-containing protein [Flavipsychrobacter sp.]
MIRMIMSTSAASAKSYFTDALIKSDYYINDQEMKGVFSGKLAERLGLKGEVDKNSFFNLCENINPATGGTLTQKTKEERTVGYDINFHCPKSVSIVHALSSDDHIMKAFSASVSETMQLIEKDAFARVRVGGADHDRLTGELAWATFIHQTARPAGASAPDPHLHAHCFTFNATYDGVEDKIKAGMFREIKRAMPFYQSYFHKLLSDKLMDLGYEVNRTKNSFEVAGVPKKALELFSKRTNEIGQVAREKGITDAKELAELGARTRKGKQKNLSMSDLKLYWRRQIADYGIRPEPSKPPIRYGYPTAKNLVTPDKCVDHSLHHSFERASVVPERVILEAALKQGIGSRFAKANAIVEKVRAHEALIKVTDGGITKCTTKEVLAEEKRMVKLARRGLDAVTPMYKESPKLELDGQQKEAVSLLLTSSNRVNIVRGGAGTGKTTLMQEAVRHIRKAGKEVFTVAPTSEASRGVLRSEGFSNAETVASLLQNKKEYDKLKYNVIWVDEAGLLGTKDMRALLELAEQQHARLILSGDTRQHASVVRGDALRILNTVAKIPVAEVNKIYRQKKYHYRTAVEHIAKGDIEAGFKQLDSIGYIRKLDEQDPYRELVRDYVQSLKMGKKSLVIAPTHKQGDIVTRQIRQTLRGEKMIGEKERQLTRLVNLNMTEAERADWRNLQKGQVVQFNQKMARHIPKGSKWLIAGVADSYVSLKGKNGATASLPLHKAKQYEVYDMQPLPIAKGDLVRITRNGVDEKKHYLHNGNVFEVSQIDKKGKIELRNPVSKHTYTISPTFGHLAHAHCLTSHASQGKTVDRVFVAQPASTFEATNDKQFYVSASRAREQVTFYTDDKAGLLNHAARVSERQSAIELSVKHDLHKEAIDRLLRSEVAKDKKQEKQIDKQPTRRARFEDRDYEPRI